MDLRAFDEFRQRDTGLGNCASAGSKDLMELRRRREKCRTKAGFFLFDRFFLFFKSTESGVIDQTDPVADLRKTHIRIILTQEYPVFGAGGHHTVRFFRSLGNKVIDQNSDICL